MYQRIHKQFGTAGLVLSIAAIVFALAGGAYAANNAATASKAGKQGKQGKQGKTGKTGPAGPAGASGPAGPAGTNGAAGKNGTNGTNGKSVVVGTATSGPSGECAEGGTTVEVEGSGTKKKVCNGSPWTAGGTLPSGASEHGVWTISGRDIQGDQVLASISFPIPLKAALLNEECGEPTGHCRVHFIPGPTPAEVGNGEAPKGPTECEEGTYKEPKAAPGNLCVYQEIDAKAFGLGGGITSVTVNDPEKLGTAGAGVSGAYLSATASFAVAPEEPKPILVTGTWAVTAE